MIFLKNIFLWIFVVIGTTFSVDAMKVSLRDNDGQKLAYAEQFALAADSASKRPIFLQFDHLASSNNYNCIQLLCGKNSLNMPELDMLYSSVAELMNYDGYNLTLAFFNNQLLILKAMSDYIFSQGRSDSIFLYDQDDHQVFLQAPEQTLKKPVALKFFWKKNQKKKKQACHKVVLMCGDLPATAEEQAEITRIVCDAVALCKGKFAALSESEIYDELMMKHPGLWFFYLQLSIMNSPYDKEALELVVNPRNSHQKTEYIEKSAVAFEALCNEIVASTNGADVLGFVEDSNPIECRQLEKKVELRAPDKIVPFRFGPIVDTRFSVLEEVDNYPEPQLSEGYVK